MPNYFRLSDMKWPNQFTFTAWQRKKISFAFNEKYQVILETYLSTLKDQIKTIFALKFDLKVRIKINKKIKKLCTSINRNLRYAKAQCVSSKIYWKLISIENHDTLSSINIPKSDK